MANRSIRLPDSMDDDLEKEAGELDKTVSEYIRDILRQRDQLVGGDEDGLDERLSDIEERLSALESRDAGHDTSAEAPAPADDESPNQTPDSLSAPAAASQDTPDAGASPQQERGRAGVAVKADSVRAKAEEAAQDAEVPGRSPGVERVRREALLWAWDYLREHEHCRSSEIANATIGAFWDEARLNYSVSPRYPGYGMWDAYLRDALAEMPGVESPGRRGKDWFFDD